MSRTVKNFFVIINILATIYMVLMLLFAASSITAIYGDLIETSSNIEKEYNETLDNYKKIIVFILKNGLPKNVNYFNSVASVTYSLPPVKNFSTGTITDFINGTIPDGSNIHTALRCYDNKCLKVFIDRKGILDKILTNKPWGHDEVTSIPIEKFTLLRVSVSSYLEDHKYFLVISLLCLFTLYFTQFLFIFIRNSKLNALYNSLLLDSTKSQQKVNKYAIKLDRLLESATLIQELVGEYFTHYVHQLITSDIHIKEMDLISVLVQVESYLTSQITKRNIKIILNYKNTINIRISSDYEIIFVILLNLVFKAIYRSKMSSEITIKISQIDDAVEIEIKDIGYDYSPKLSDKIQFHELPNPILENLFQKIKAEVKEFRENDINTISIKIAVNSNIYKNSQLNNIIKLNSGVRH